MGQTGRQFCSNKPLGWVVCKPNRSESRGHQRALGVPFLLFRELREAVGDGRVEGMLLRDRETGEHLMYEADCICLAVGLSPLIELPCMLGCRLCYSRELGGWVPWHDQWMHTSQEGVYVAGDVAGVEEASIAMEEGRLAAAYACGRSGALSEAEAEKSLRETTGRLYELRDGPYNYGRRAAKDRLWST